MSSQGNQANDAANAPPAGVPNGHEDYIVPIPRTIAMLMQDNTRTMNSLLNLATTQNTAIQELAHRVTLAAQASEETNKQIRIAMSRHEELALIQRVQERLHPGPEAKAAAIAALQEETCLTGLGKDVMVAQMEDVQILDAY